MFGTLCSKMLHQQFDFSSSNLVIQVDKKIGQAEIAIELRNFVFKNEMIAKRVPCELANQPVVLVQVCASVSENDVWRRLTLEFLKIFLHRRANRARATGARPG